MCTVCFFVSFDRIFIRSCLNLRRIMSDVVPYYGGRDGTCGFNYGPWTFGEVKDKMNSDTDSLPPVDHDEISHDE